MSQMSIVNALPSASAAVNPPVSPTFTSPILSPAAASFLVGTSPTHTSSPSTTMKQWTTASLDKPATDGDTDDVMVVMEHSTVTPTKEALKKEQDTKEVFTAASAAALSSKVLVFECNVCSVKFTNWDLYQAHVMAVCLDFDVL